LHNYYRCLALSLCLVFWFATAQVTVRGSLGGEVLDPSANRVSDAEITVVQDGTNLRSTTTTDAEGNFHISALPPGTYTIFAEKAGFQKLQRTGITIEVNQAARVKLMLSVGEVSTTVNVVADAPVVQSQASEVSMLIGSKQIRDLPLNGKDFQKLMLLAPGAGNFRSNNSNSNVSTSGTRESSNNYVIDGITANDERETAGLALGASFRQQPNIISTEAVSEYRVITSNADASFGRGAGAQVNVVTRSGTNELHGSAYEYLRNSALDARDFFNRGPFFTSDGRAKTPPFRQNLFGVTGGGPIQKNRHFVFGSYEGFRQRLEQTSAPVLPSADLVNLMPGQMGVLGRAFYFDQNIVPRTGYVDRTVRAFSAADRTAAIAAGFPGRLFDADFANGEAATVVTSRSSTRDFDQNAFLVRTDHVISDKLSLTFRHVHTKYTSVNNSSGLPGTGVRTPGEYISPTAQATWSVSPSQVLEIRGGVMRRFTDNQIAGGLPDSITALGIAEQRQIGIGLTGTTAFQLPAIQPFLLLDAQTVPQAAVTHSWTRSGWTLRTGLDLRWVAANFINKNFPRPTYNFVGLTGPNGILGSSPASAEAVAQVATQTIFGANGGPTTPLRGWRSPQQEYFAQFDWRVRRGLTLNLGLRYSYFGVYREVNDGLSNLYATGPNGAENGTDPFEYGRTANQVLTLGDDRPFYSADRNNFQPRLGFAWNIGGSDRSILRGAFGLYNDRLYQLLISDSARNVPYAVTGNATNVPFAVGRPVPINAQTPTFFAVNPALRNPLIRRYNLSFEQRLGENTSVTAAYVRTDGTSLFMPVDPNFTGAYPQAQRPDPRFADQRLLTNDAFSKYHALQIYARRRTAQGLTFTASYAWSRYWEITSNDTGPQLPTVINTGATPAPGFQIGPTVQRPIDSEYGPSENDAPQALAVSAVWDVPVGRRRKVLAGMPGVLDAIIGGWSLSSLVNARSGNTFDVQLGQDVNDDGAFNDRPALASGSNLEAVQRRDGFDKTQWLVPQSTATQVLVVPSNVTDPFASIRRNSFRGPSLFIVDASLTKRFALGERFGLQFDANAFNILNRANFRPPVSTLTSPFFGQIQATAVNSTPRQIQFGLKLTF
jgi:hypothetical protein